MDNASHLLDQALDLINLELDSLRSGNVEEAGEMAVQRRALVEEALQLRQQHKDAILRQKLERLMELQSALNTEARTLHSRLKQELQRVKKESRRFAGYRDGAKITPLASKYLSRTG
ncbi:MAG: hypothetical protein ACOC24_01390 [Desulfovibrionales bacterium]